MKNFQFYLFLILITCIIASCDSASEGPPQSYKTTEPNVVITQPINYGNGVYYFNCTERQFALSLSNFLSDTTKHVEAMTGNGTGGYGYDLGYFVIVK